VLLCAQNQLKAADKVRSRRRGLLLNEVNVVEYWNFWFRLHVTIG